MITKLSHITFTVFILFYSEVKSQSTFIFEREGALPEYNLPKNETSKIIYHESYYFLIDTLSIPFVDDFSTNKQKNFIYPNPLLIKDSTYHKYRINSSLIDTILYSKDTSFSYIYNMSTSSYDTIPNNFMYIYIYEDLADLNLPTDSIKVWPIFQYEIDQNTDTIQTFTVPVIDTLFNPVTIKIVEDSPSLWIDQYPNAYINQTFSDNPPTIGMATFDGVDYLGQPYNRQFPNTYGEADFLTSKPIYLNFNPIDSIYLSFYFQMQGLGDDPEKEDSLVLEFYSPETKKWHYVWSTEGAISTLNFQEVKIGITDTLFLVDGFQFRFKNYATLSGAYDHWNIDYVILDKNRTKLPEEIIDVAFVKPLYSMIQPYSRMPWKHYKQTGKVNMISNTSVPLANLGNTPRFVNKTDYFYDVDNSLLQSNTELAFPALFTGTSPMNISIFSNPNTFEFPLNSFDRSTFTFKEYVDVTPDVNEQNDTLIHQQVFDTYYSYDDGSAEASYILTGVGTKVAQKYTIAVTDTLKGLLFYFPKGFLDAMLNDIRIVVWKDINTDDRLFESIVTPYYAFENNGFIRFSLEDSENPVIVDGTFYIGWENLSNIDVLVGLDKNNNNKSYLFVNVSGWFGSSIDGTVMMRPDFGQANLQVSVTESKNELQNLIQLYPNPTQNILHISSSNPIQEIYLYQITGELVMQNMHENIQQINVSSLPSGIYILKIKEQYKSSLSTHKIIIQK